MGKSGSSSHLKPESTPPQPEQLRRRRRPCAACACCALLTLLLLAAIVLILALTVFKPRHPELSLVSVTVDGVSPRVTFPALRVELNVTLDVDFLVSNPNRVSFSHAVGAAELFYGSNKVGDAVVAPGRVPSHGSAHVKCRLTLEADRFAADLHRLLRDVLAGRVALDTATRIPGRVHFLGLVKKNVVAVSSCHVVIGFPILTLVEQQCRERTER